jgi:hypothetical protein
MSENDWSAFAMRHMRTVRQCWLVLTVILLALSGVSQFRPWQLAAGQSDGPAAFQEVKAMPQEPRGKTDPPSEPLEAWVQGNAPAAQPAVLCRVIQKVYHNGWKTCGEIAIHADASYSWTTHDVWGSKRVPKVFHGTLPKRAFDEVSASSKESDQFKKVKGVPSYEFGIDDYRTKHPEGIEPLTLFLMGRPLTPAGDPGKQPRQDGVARLTSEMPPEKLRQIADDTTADRIKRVEAIFTLFASYLQPPKDVSTVRDALGQANWLKDAKLEGIYTLGGKIPLEWRQGDSVFVLHLFPDRDGYSNQVIYFELSGGAGRTADEGLAFLRGGKGLKGNAKLVEFTLCFGDDRFERFSDRGTRASNSAGSVAQVDEITLKRFGHAEKAPYYEVRLSKDGTVTYTGEFNVARIGTFKAKIEREDFRRLEQMLNRFRYFEMTEEYLAGPDAPHVRTSALRAGKRKTIEDGWGSAAPVELWAIEMAIDGLIAQITDWKQSK